MRKVALLVCMLFVVALVSPLMAGGKTHGLKGEVVSVDLEGKKLTFKDDKGQEQTAPVMGKALETLKNLKAGDKVELTCTDNEKGEHEGISAIKMAKEGAKK